MKIADVMSRGVQLATAEQTIQEAARLMRDLDVGVLPVGTEDSIQGIITDRDIAVRAVAEGHGPDTRVSQVMTAEVESCEPGQDVAEVAKMMGDRKIRRLPVMDGGKLVGIVALGDLAIRADSAVIDDALTGISEPGGPASQGDHEQSTTAADDLDDDDHELDLDDDEAEEKPRAA